MTFAELDADATRIARGLQDWGVPSGTRMALLVQPGIEFVTLVFALLRAGMVTILIDPGMGRRNALARLAEAEPEGFIAVPAAQALRTVLRRRFPRAKWNVTVGRRWGWGGTTLDALRHRGDGTQSVSATADLRSATLPDSPAAIIFTSGSTGPAKGVLYTHRMFETQVSEIQSTYGIEPGGVDLACFPLFALFNSAMGVTTVMPEMDFSRPAAADPRKLLDAANDWQVTQAFASPAVWQKLSDCERTGLRIDSLRQIFSCGAPVRAKVIRATLRRVAPNAKMHTPYGATECLPVATNEAGEILGETAAKTDEGAGICVGRRFNSIDWRIIRISDEPIATMNEVEELSPGQIGELIVRGPQVSPMYVTRVDANDAAKITDGSASWHRTGDVGYLDDQGRFWYCGRKSQRVETADGPLFTECVEGIFNAHRDVARTALVAVRQRGTQVVVLVVEPTSALRVHHRRRSAASAWDGMHQFFDELRAWGNRYGVAGRIDHFLLHWNPLPVDVRHNSKIRRESLAYWAATEGPEMCW
jgi:acyl-CoA synthetase (AMP-forming)/AMP-acid ligase II